MSLHTALWRAIAVAVTAGATVGCATVTRGTSESFTVESTPPAAQVKTSTGFSCQSTPCTFKMERKTGFSVMVTKDGYKPYQAKIKSGVATGGGAGFLGNALVGGVIGGVVDATSGAMNDLTPNPVRALLEPLPVVATAPAPAPVASPMSAPAQVAAQPASPSTPPVAIPAPAAQAVKL